MARTAFDLSAIRQEVDPKGPYRDLRNQLRTYESVCSVLWDLKEVEASLNALYDLNSTETGVRGVQGRGLLLHAVIAYCRATHSEGKARAKFNVLPAYCEEQKEQHRHIVMLRNQTFAHHGGGEGAFGEGWYVERALLILAPGGPNALTHYRSGYLYSERVVIPLQALLESAVLYVNAERKRREPELFEFIRSLIRSDKAFAETIGRHSIDVQTLFEGTPPLDQWKTGKDHVIWSSDSG